MDKDLDDKRHRIEETRRQWGTVFNNLRLARERWQAAWYYVDNQSMWIQEEEQRLQGIEREVRRARNDLEARKK